MSNVLYLPMNKKWYDMVLSGEKKQEYRLLKPYWETRIRNWISQNLPGHSIYLPIVLCGDKGMYDERRLPICFVNGYGNDAPRFIGYCYKIEVRRIALHKDWGEKEYEGVPHFVLHLGHIEEEQRNENK